VKLEFESYVPELRKIGCGRNSLLPRQLIAPPALLLELTLSSLIPCPFHFTKGSECLAGFLGAMEIAIQGCELIPGHDPEFLGPLGIGRQLEVFNGQVILTQRRSALPQIVVRVAEGLIES